MTRALGGTAALGKPGRRAELTDLRSPAGGNVRGRERKNAGYGAVGDLYSESHRRTARDSSVNVQPDGVTNIISPSA
jgi:hypothetical protein